ncbi:MAG: UDP-glucose:undecaprenyl-phosphate glucose-1-phosphate transferase [Elusimicrobia bacterium ADurb.Bin231]|nr:MAG: UDP-glucose:undecaprenyl-phosphate glucose-1-phosphate transferase [Elusimicrobia bacterium ADurb.Bin231]
MKQKIRRVIFPVALFFADIISVYISFILAYWIRFYSGLLPVLRGIPPFGLYHTAIFVVILLWCVIFVYSDFYGTRKIDALNEFLKITKGVLFGTVIIAALTFLYRDFTFSRIMLVLAFGISVCVIFITHELIGLVDVYVGNFLLGTHNVLVVGESSIADDIRKALRHRKKFEVYHSHSSDSEHLKKMIQNNGINEVIYSMGEPGHGEIIRISNICDDLGVDFRFVPDVLEIMRGEIVIDEFLEVPVFRFKATSLHGWNFFVKRVTDVLLSLLILSVAGIPLIIVSLLIKMEDGGSVFYKHKRRGYRGQDFDFIKFRTMVANADKILESIKHLSERGGPVFKMKDDPRITKIGKYLRKFSIDEMPQFINVLKGNMSIVGPRPQVIWEAEHYDDVAKKRLKVLPGITGLWQIKGRASVSYEEMIRLDIFYMEHWSLALDLKIILKTIPAMLSGKGAY